MISRELATDWLQRWDNQQTKYIPNRHERFEVIADLVEVCVDKPNPVIVDLGVGPGSLTRHLQERIPDATIIGLDKDPVLLEMSRAMGYDVRNVDLNAADWWEQAGIDAAPDAFVSTTALHWLDAEAFAQVVSRCREVLAPGGVFIDGDHFYHRPAAEARAEGAERAITLDGIGIALEEKAAERAGVSSNQSWEAWWEEIAAVPEFAELLQQREAVYGDRQPAKPPTISQFHEMAADFRSSGCCWQHGADHILYAVK